MNLPILNIRICTQFISCLSFVAQIGSLSCQARRVNISFKDIKSYIPCGHTLLIYSSNKDNNNPRTMVTHIVRIYNEDTHKNIISIIK